MQTPFSLSQCWHPVARTDDVDESPRRLVLLDKPLVAYCHNGETRVFPDLCIHRGTALSRGWVDDDGQLVCGYHGWRYGKDGRCTLIPSLSDSTRVPAKARIDAYAVREAYGLVWVSLAESVLPFPHWIDGTYDDPGYRFIDGVDYEWNASAARAVENFMDMSHFAFVHEGILGSRDETVTPVHQVSPTETGFTYAFKAPEPLDLHSGDELVTWEYELVAPFTIHLSKRSPSSGRTIITLVASPVAPDRTRMFLFIGRNHALDPSEDEGFRDFTHTIMEQDRQIVESQRPQDIPIDLRDEMHLRVPDASGIAYRRLLADVAEHDEYFLV